jgi:hypothetical protein
VPEVVDDKVCTRSREMQRIQAPRDGLVHAALVINSWVGAEEPRGGQGDVSGVGASFFK